MSKVLRALEEEAKDEGRVEGRVEALKTMARKLLLKGMNIDEIVEITGLSQEEIENLT